MVINVNIVDTVIDLAIKRNYSEDIYSKKFSLDDSLKTDNYSEHSDSSEWIQLKTSEENLVGYLTSLDFEVIKELQVLIYIGRDKPYKEISDGLQRFEKYYNDFNANGWKDKTVEINTIIEKTPLPDYLLEGKKILGW